MDVEKVQLPFRICLCGGTGTGKSFWLCRMLKSLRPFPFYRVYLICASHSLRQPTWIEFAEYCDRVDADMIPMDHLPDEDEAETIFNDLGAHHREGKQSLVIVDDMINEMARETPQSRFVSSLYTSGRHVSCSVAVLAQHPRPKNMLLSRLNSTLLGLFNFSDHRAVEGLLQQLFRGDAEQRAYRAWAARVGPPGRAVFVDLLAAPSSNRLLDENLKPII